MTSAHCSKKRHGDIMGGFCALKKKQQTNLTSHFSASAAAVTLSISSGAEQVPPQTHTHFAPHFYGAALSRRTLQTSWLGTTAGARCTSVTDRARMVQSLLVDVRSSSSPMRCVYHTCTEQQLVLNVSVRYDVIHNQSPRSNT